MTLIIGVLLMRCSDKNVEKITIASEKTIGYGVAPMECYLVKVGDDKDWSLFYSPIEGFNYENGYEYVIKVKKEKIDNPPADGSSIKYTLVKVISKKKLMSKGLPNSYNSI